MLELHSNRCDISFHLTLCELIMMLFELLRLLHLSPSKLSMNKCLFFGLVYYLNEFHTAKSLSQKVVKFGNYNLKFTRNSRQ